MNKTRYSSIDRKAEPNSSSIETEKKLADIVKNYVLVLDLDETLVHYKESRFLKED